MAMFAQRLPDVVEDACSNQVANVHDHVDDRERDRALSRSRIPPRGGDQHWSAERLPDDQRKQAARKREPFYCRKHHDGAPNQPTKNTKNKSSSNADRLSYPPPYKSEH